MFLKLRYQLAQFIDKHIRKLRFKSTDFCLVSNNCWGAMHFYQRFGISYNVPTVGLFISDTDFMKFCNDLQYYLKQQITFIDAKHSPAYEEVCCWGNIDPNCNDFFNFPVGVLGDITLWFMHYKSEDEARTKWERRAARVNLNKIVVKWSQRYTDGDNMVKRFLEIPYPKFAFVDESCNISSHELIKLPGWNKIKNEGGDEISFTSQYVNVYNTINGALNQRSE